jgi:hypothetical protein
MATTLNEERKEGVEPSPFMEAKIFCLQHPDSCHILIYPCRITAGMGIGQIILH